MYSVLANFFARLINHKCEKIMNKALSTGQESWVFYRCSLGGILPYVASLPYIIKKMHFAQTFLVYTVIKYT